MLDPWAGETQWCQLTWTPWRLTTQAFCIAELSPRLLPSGIWHNSVGPQASSSRWWNTGTQHRPLPRVWGSDSRRCAWRTLHPFDCNCSRTLHESEVLPQLPSSHPLLWQVLQLHSIPKAALAAPHVHVFGKTHSLIVTASSQHCITC